ncbi:MAG: molybdopterin-dependent oxidoreductase [bacterium]|nr:molybdopterin-dependent oxidoreductase [bacterium]MCY4257640.1 molybdopterin-dependent oxidoreductase [bacterium]
MSELEATHTSEHKQDSREPLKDIVPSFWMAMIGLVAAGAALGVSEILSGTTSRRVPSLVVSVADVMVDNTPGFIARWSIEQLGSAQKPALVWGIVVVALLLGAGLGWASSRRSWVMPAGLVVFAVLGGWAGAHNPVYEDGWGWFSGFVSGTFAIAVYMGLHLLGMIDFEAVRTRSVRTRSGGIDAAGAADLGDVSSADAASQTGDVSSTDGVQVSSEPSTGRTPVPMVGRGRFNNRRRFVGAVGAMAGASLVGGLLGRWLRRRDTVEGARQGFASQALQNRTVATPAALAELDSSDSAVQEASEPGATPTATATQAPDATAQATSEATAEPTPTVTAEAPRRANFDYIEGIDPLITPNDDFYLIDTALSYPQVDPEDWSLRIHGMVDREVEIGYEELLDLGLVQEQVTLSCVSNSVGGGLVGNAEWVGVPLANVLQQAGIQRGATQIVGRSIDRWTAGFPTEVALDGRVALVAVQMNGEPLPIAHGFPARLVVSGLYGYVSATKWLSEIELTTWEGFDGFWIPRGWSKEGPIKTQSRIDVPRRGEEVAPGPTAIAGVAWAPHRAIEKVEVQVDDEPWVEADLSRETTINSWRQWMVTWDATPGDHRVRVRATDGTGTTQTPEISEPAPDGATGWHTIQVRAQET